MAAKKKSSSKKARKPKVMKAITVEVTEAQLKKLTAYAAASPAKSTVGDIARKAITAGLKRAKVKTVKKVTW